PVTLVDKENITRSPSFRRVRLKETLIIFISLSPSAPPSPQPPRRRRFGPLQDAVEPDAPSPSPTFHCRSEEDPPSFVVSSTIEASVLAAVSHHGAVKSAGNGRVFCSVSTL
ncbi:hypothetical protein PIB30_097484, partial [Stylosanthes scabra]|nr:hypothetical protein [Stylosanthes scabra]